MGNTERKGVCCVLTGPSGAGKDAVMEELKIRLGYSQVLTRTSRPMRPGERDGVDYDFLTRGEFEAGIAAGAYLEHVEYRPGEHKGTPKAAIEKVLNGENVFWRIDPVAAANAVNIVREGFPDKGEEIAQRMAVVYIAPGNWEDIERRYFARDPGADRKIFAARFERDKQVWRENRDKYDFVVVNHDGGLHNTIATVELILRTI